MADPFSIASGIAGLITLADVVISRTYNTIIACKRASEDSRKLLHEVQALAGILQSLDTLATKVGPSALQAHVSAPNFFACQKTLERIRDKLEKADPKEQGKSMIQRVKRTLKWPLSASDTEEVLAEMERHKATFNLALSIDALDAILDSQHTEEMLADKLDEVTSTIRKLWKIEQTKENRRLLELVGADTADEAYRSSSKLRQYDTGLWFCESGQPFSEWLATRGSKLWVFGIPGAGKTVLSALAISETVKSASSNHAVAFFYCSHKDESSQHLPGILACFIGQFSRQNGQCMAIFEEAARSYEGVKVQTWVKNEDHLLSILRKMLRVLGEVSIIVDGIDECFEIASITETLSKLALEFSHIRMSLFSRKLSEMEPFLEGFEMLSIAAESEDLRLYVNAQIAERSRLRKLRIRNTDVKDEIIEKLVTGAEGMFRWVTCQLDHLCTLNNDRERLDALQKLPRTLESTYDRILERLNERSESARQLVQRTMIWILGDKKLGVLQLCEAVSIEHHSKSLDRHNLIDVEDILINCSSLVRLSADGCSVESAHFTVNEYFRTIDTTKKPELARYLYDPINANTYRAETCLIALNFDTMAKGFASNYTSLMEELRRFPFYLRAAGLWHYFARRAHPCASLETATSRLFLSPSRKNFENWRLVFVLCQHRASRVALENACRLRKVVRSDNNDSTALEDQSKSEEEHCVAKADWDHAIWLASSLNELHIAAVLHLSHLLAPLAATNNLVNNHSAIGTPLHCALLGEGLFSLVRGDVADDDSMESWAQDQAKRQSNEHSGQAREAAVKALIKLGADLSIDLRTSRHRLGHTSTFLAYQVGMLRLVIESGAKVDDATAKHLLNNFHSFKELHGSDNLGYLRKADFSKVTDRTIVLGIMYALDRCHMSRPAAVSSGPLTITDGQNQLPEDYEGAVAIACARDHVEYVRWMFETHGIPIDYQSRVRKITILHMACKVSAPAVLEYAISRKANIEAREEGGLTPLGVLLREGELDYVDEDMAYTSTEDEDPEHGATFTDQWLRVLKLLLGAKASLTDVDGHKNSALMCWADDQPCVKSVPMYCDALKLLMAHGGDPMHRNDDDECVWHRLASNWAGHRLADSVASLWTPEALKDSLALQDEYGFTPLHRAVYSSHAKMMKILIDLGSDTAARTADDETILHLAARVLKISKTPLDIALRVDWSNVDRTADGKAALHCCIRELDDSEDDLPSDMPSRLRGAMAELSVFATKSGSATKSIVGCVKVMARMLAMCEDHEMVEDAQCGICSIRLECFLVILQTSSEGCALAPEDLSGLTVLFKGLRAYAGTQFRSQCVRTTCGKAICAILSQQVWSKSLHNALKTSSALNLAISCRHHDVLHALLRFERIVDEPGLCDDGLSFMQRLCQASAPSSVVEVALTHTKQLYARTSRGYTLLHLCLRPSSQETPQSSDQMEVVDLLITAGLDVDAKSEDGTGETALMMSAKLPSSAILDLLLRNKAAIDARDDFGGNALSNACRHGALACVTALVQRGCPVLYSGTKFQKLYGQTHPLGPVQEAIWTDDPEFLDGLHQIFPYDASVEDNLEVPSPLWVACAAGKLQSVQYWLSKGANTAFRSAAEGMTPLHVAAACNRVDIAKRLLGSGCDPSMRDYNGLTARRHALQSHSFEVAQLLIPSRSTENSDPATATDDDFGVSSRTRLVLRDNCLPDSLRHCILDGDLDQLEQRVTDKLHLGFRFQSCACTPIVTAVSNGEVEIVEYLQANEIDVTGCVCKTHKPCQYPAIVMLASQEDMLGPLQKAVNSRRAWPLETLEHMLHAAAGAGNVAAIELILAADASLVNLHPRLTRPLKPIFIPSSDGWESLAGLSATALHTAVFAEQLESTALLLKSGFNPDVLDETGATAMHLAVELSFDMLKLIFPYSSSVDVRDSSLRTPLALACQSGESNMVEYLLQHGADATATDEHGRSSLTAATGSIDFDFDVVISLITAGAIPSVPDILDIFAEGFRSILMFSDYIQRVIAQRGFLNVSQEGPLLDPLLRFAPPHLRQRGLTSPVWTGGPTALYRAASSGAIENLKLLRDAGAMLNQEGGPEGTPLMGACKAGRLDVVRYLVNNGALLSYNRLNKHVSALDKAASYPKILRWLLVRRFAERRTIEAGSADTFGDKDTDRKTHAGELDMDQINDGSAEATLDLILRKDLEQYLESKNWFLPMRRFLDRGDGCFDTLPIDPSEFHKFRPANYATQRT